MAPEDHVDGHARVLESGTRISAGLVILARIVIAIIALLVLLFEYGLGEAHALHGMLCTLMDQAGPLRSLSNYAL